MNNSVLSKTMRNFRRKINVRLVNNAKDYIGIQANQGIQANEFLFHRRYLVKILLLFMKLNQF